MKRLLLGFFGMIMFYGIIHATDVNFSIKKKGSEIFERSLSLDGDIFLTHFRNDNYELFISFVDDKDKEHTQTELKGLVDELIKVGYEDCMFKDFKTNEYIRIYNSGKLEGSSDNSFSSLSITFKEDDITQIQLIVPKQSKDNDTIDNSIKDDSTKNTNTK